MKVIRFIIRLIALPFISTLALIAALVSWITFTINFIKRGGEVVAYTKDFNPKSVTRMMLDLQDRLNEIKPEATK